MELTKTKELYNSVKEGSVVRVDYIAKSEGLVFDTSMEEEAREAEIFSDKREYSSLKFEVGKGEMLPGFEEALLGMKEGDVKEIIVPPHKGYGLYKEERVRKIPRSFIERQGVDVELGSNLVLRTRKGVLKAHVCEIDSEEVTLDLNPEFAGKMLDFKIFLREIVG